MITVVTANSGRCGTSLTMQMLQAAGVPLFWNRLPNKTTINPFGHYEIQGRTTDWTPDYVASILCQAEGKAIKVFWSRLPLLTDDHDYRFIELQRDAECMYNSQTVMMRAENRLADKLDPRRSITGIQQSHDDLHRWLVLRSKRFITVHFYQLFNGEGPAAIAEFLSLDSLSVAKMMECAEPSLWHFKPSQGQDDSEGPKIVSK
jgi:hypothetical protein